MSSLTAAEERQSSITQTLDYVEVQQSDLESLLDSYEQQAARALESANGGYGGMGSSGGAPVARSMEMGAADAERERA